MEESLPLSLQDDVARPASAARPLSLRLYMVGVSLPVLAIIAARALSSPGVHEQIRAGAPWIVALFFIEMFPIPVWRDVRVSLGFPLVLFLGVLFPPAAVALFVLLGSGDPRELTGQSDVLRAIFNRCQVAGAALASTATLHALTPDPHLGAAVLGAALLASTVNLGLNMLVVAGAARLDYRRPLWQVLRRLVLGNSWPLQILYLGLGLLGVAMALVYREVGTWALVGLVPPLLAIRPLLRISTRLERAEEQLEQETALNRLAEQLAEERRRDREGVAAILHDEVAPLLVAARHGLEAALAGDGDRRRIDEMRSALTEANGQVRALIREMLGSSAGAGGLLPGLRALFAQLEQEHGLVVEDRCQAVSAPHPVEELLYAIAREAARNAVRHGGAGRLRVTLEEASGEALMSVSDDGRGSTPTTGPPTTATSASRCSGAAPRWRAARYRSPRPPGEGPW